LGSSTHTVTSKIQAWKGKKKNLSKTPSKNSAQRQVSGKKNKTTASKQDNLMKRVFLPLH